MMESNSATPPSAPSGTGLDLLDFMFTIAISLGLAPELMNGGKGVLSENWVRQMMTPDGTESFDLMVLFLGLLVLTLSWVGYRESLKKVHLDTAKLWGVVRFVADVLLVVLYGFILVSFKDFQRVLFLTTLVLAVYGFWDIVKMLEHGPAYADVRWQWKRKEWWREILWFPVTVVFTLLTLAVGVLPSQFWQSTHRVQGVLPSTTDWLILLFAIFVVCIARVLKNQLERVTVPAP